jgi:hypothetical protein
MKTLLYILWHLLWNFIKGGFIGLVIFFLGAYFLNFICFPLIFSDSSLIMLLGWVLFLGFIIGVLVLVVWYLER